MKQANGRKGNKGSKRAISPGKARERERETQTHKQKPLTAVFVDPDVAVVVALRDVQTESLGLVMVERTQTFVPTPSLSQRHGLCPVDDLGLAVMSVVVLDLDWVLDGLVDSFGR